MSKTSISPNFEGTRWDIFVTDPDKNVDSAVFLGPDGKGHSYFVDNIDKLYEVIWSIDEVNYKLIWSMENTGFENGHSYPLNFENYWQMGYNGGEIIMGLGNASYPVSGFSSFNFNQKQFQ